MMCSRFFCFFGILLGFGPAFASTIEFSSTVVSSFGPFDTLLGPGSDVIVTYSVDNGALDSNPDPDAGNYQTGLLSMTFEFPGQDIIIDFGSGIVSVFNDTANPDDQLAYRSFNDITGSLSGEEVLIGEFGVSGSTTMLSGDAVPVFFPTDITSLNVSIGTASGFTQLILNNDVVISSVPVPGTALLLLVPAGLLANLRRF